MNIFELAIFGVNCGAGYYAGKLLSERIGTTGWFVGAPVGFLLSFACFYGLAKLLESKRRHAI